MPTYLQHHLFLLTLHGQLHLAPIKPDPHNVLDIGTGTGIWAIDFGESRDSELSITYAGQLSNTLQPLLSVVI
jgi:ubiquinone/menaquinone biosynthesis C-methylase UbiE